MAEDDQTNQKPEKAADADERRPYQPPGIERRARFETLALGCGFNDPFTTGCPGNYSTS